MESRKSHIFVGLFVVVGVLALLFIALRAASGSTVTAGETYTLYAKFDNIGSLKVRSPVKVGGVVVGRVTDISLAGEYYEPLVEMEISKDYDKFSETSSLSVLTAGFAGQDPISMGVIVKLIRSLNESLGLTSIVVSHDVDEVLSIADYAYIIADKKVVAEGTPAELENNDKAIVRQFLQGEADGPVKFHYTEDDFAMDLMGEAHG